MKKDITKRFLKKKYSKSGDFEQQDELKDPDGFGLILTVQEKKLLSNDSTTQLLRDQNILTWEQLLNYIRKIPYGRTTNRTDFKLVMSEHKGTCSSKHALVKQIADLNQIKGVELILSMYKMRISNTEGIGRHLTDNALEYIPEAHCYLKINGKRIDLTNTNSDVQKLEDDIIEELKIEPYQVSEFKVDYHKAFIKRWKEEMGLKMDFDEIWSIREKCISELTK